LVVLAKNLKNLSLTFLFGFKVEKFKNYLNELEEFPIQKFLIFCSRYGPLQMCQNSFTLVQ